MFTFSLVQHMAISATTKPPHQITGIIHEDIKWIKIKLSSIPAKSIYLQFSIAFKADSCTPYLVMSTEEYTINDQYQCISAFRGQVSNKKFIIPLTCQKFSGISKCNIDNSNISCSIGNLHIQDWKPRLFWAGFGFACDRKSHEGCEKGTPDLSEHVSNCVKSLQGLSYEITIKNHFNDSTCSPISKDVQEICQLNYTHAATPTLVGFQNLEGIEERYIRPYYDIYKQGTFCWNCHQNVVKAFCHISLTPCQSFVPHEMLPVCKEMCEEVSSACTGCVPYQFGGQVNCSYLPSRYSTEDIPCFYEAVDCGVPLNKTDAYISNYNSTNVYGKAVYTCYDTSLSLKNGGISRCMFSGKWSSTEPCIENHSEMLLVAITVSEFLTLLLLTIIVICFYLRNRKKNGEKYLTRQREFDSAVFYAYVEIHEQFVHHLQEELEINLLPPFKLLIHGRDFKAGRDIKHNIRDAVQNSSSAIILMSQDFVDSLWCREEFEECYIENKKDPAFQMFVIMMEARENLTNLTAYMEAFFDTKTYLEISDGDLLKKT